MEQNTNDHLILLEEWLSRTDDQYEATRIAMYMVIYALASDDFLSQLVVLKGGSLMSLNYKSKRHTSDIDLSLTTSGAFDIDVFIERFKNALTRVNLLFISKGIVCRFQNYSLNPKKTFDTDRFPAIKIKVGYSHKDSINQIKQLENGMASNVISIDLSLNEILGDLSEIIVSDNFNDERLKVYSFHTLMAEKFRSVLQQIDRKRNRRQDIYDLNFLINRFSTSDEDEKHKVLATLINISQEKGIEEWLHKGGLADKGIEDRSKQDAKTLDFESKEDFDIDLAYENVRKYYELMPWDLYEN